MLTRGLPDPLQSQTIAAGESASFTLRKNIFTFILNAKDDNVELRWKYGTDTGLNLATGAYRTIPAGQNGGVGAMWIDRNVDIHVYNPTSASTEVDFQALYGIGSGDTRGMPEDIEVLEIGADSTEHFKLRKNSISFILFTRGTPSLNLEYKFGEFGDTDSGIQIQNGYEDGLTGLWIDRDTEIHIKNPNSATAYVEIEKHIGVG